MTICLTTLRTGGSCYDVHDADDGFSLVRKSGRGIEFDIIARRVLDSAGDHYTAFPLRDKNQQYELIHVVPHIDG